MGVGGQCQTPAALPRERDPVPIVQEAGWVPGPVWTGGENLARSAIRPLDSPARSESLYRLSHLGPSIGGGCSNTDKRKTEVLENKAGSLRTR